MEKRSCSPKRCHHQWLEDSKASNLPEWLRMFDPRKAAIHFTLRSYLFSFLCFWWLTASRLRQMFRGSKVYLMRLLLQGCSSAPSSTRSLLLQPLFSLLISSDSELQRTYFCRRTKFFSFVLKKREREKEKNKTQSTRAKGTRRIRQSDKAHKQRICLVRKGERCAHTHSAPMPFSFLYILAIKYVLHYIHSTRSLRSRLARALCLLCQAHIPHAADRLKLAVEIVL